jgi:hypothetical protein
MEKRQTSVITANKRLIRILLTVSILLLIPLMAMRFTDEVKWTLLDFIAAGTLLFSTGLIFEFIMRKAKTTKLKIVMSITLFIALFLIWAELAVGIFGSPIAGN